MENTILVSYANKLRGIRCKIRFNEDLCIYLERKALEITEELSKYNPELANKYATEILNKLGKQVEEFEELKEDDEIKLSKRYNGNVCVCCGKPVNSDNKCTQVCNKCASEYEF